MLTQKAISIVLSAIVLVTCTAASSKEVSQKNVSEAQQAKFSWSDEVKQLVSQHLPESEQSEAFLKVVADEAKRANLEPYLVLAVIELSSGFKKYKVAVTGERGYMQVPPYWVKLIGEKDSNLFHTLTNIRFGCTIIRHFIDENNGDVRKALTKYGGEKLATLTMKRLKAQARK